MPSKAAKENKHINDFESDRHFTVLRSNPQRIVFEITNKCNLRCRMCGQSHRKFSGVDMSIDTFMRTECFWPTAYDVSLFGWGEPLLNPHLEEFFYIVSAHQPRIFVLTNGMVLTEALIKKFIEGDLAFLNISVDGATPETYNTIRRGSDFHTVIANIKKIVEAKKKYNTSNPYLRMVFVGMRKNIEEFPMFVELASKLGVDEAKMVYMIAYGDEMVEQVLFYHKELSNRILEEAEEKAVKLKIKVTLPEKFLLNEEGGNGKDVQLKRRNCLRPWDELFVQSDGRVRLCMLSHEIMGDLHRESVEMIWNNKKFQQFRKTVNSEHPISTCRHCPQYKEMNVNDINSFIHVNTVLPGI
jgi:radical SAM protein with 4Fe4S-binding SPASM domain